MKSLSLITTRFPWPPTNGFANKNLWLIKELSKDFEINLHVIQHAKVTSDAIAKVSPYCKRIKIYKPSVLDILCGLFISLTKDRPIQLSLYHSNKAKKNIYQEIESGSQPLISVIRSAQFIEKNEAISVCCLADSLGQHYLRDAKKKPLFKRLIYLEEGRRMLKYERKIVNSAYKSLFFNQEEIKKHLPEKVELAPHGVDPNIFLENETNINYGNGITIFGKMNFEPNIDAAIWFSKNVLPLLPKNIDLYILGAQPSKKIIALTNQDPRIKVLGYVDNPYPILRGALANVCPTFTGGGIQNKLIEGLAAGCLNIASPLAASAMADLQGSGLLVCDTPQKWAEQLLEIYKNPEFYQPLRKMGQNYALKNFSWQAYSRKINSLLEEAEAHKND